MMQKKAETREIGPADPQIPPHNRQAARRPAFLKSCHRSQQSVPALGHCVIGIMLGLG